MLNFKFIVKLSISFSIILVSLIGCEETLFEPDLSDDNVVLLSPIDGARTFNNITRFEWLAVEGASRYQVQLAFPNFENLDFIIFDRIIDTIFIIDTLKQTGNYEWRVRALLNDEATPYTSSKIELLDIPAFEFQNVSLAAPSNNTLSNTLINTLEWEALNEAESYEIQILNAMSEVLITERTADTTIEITFPEGASTWQVRAINGETNTAFSTRNITVDTVIPEKPNLTAPINGSTIAEADLEFSWTRTAVEGTMEKDSIYIFTDAALTELKLKQEATSPFSPNLEVDTYYWRVQAFDDAGNQSEESDVFSVTTN